MKTQHFKIKLLEFDAVSQGILFFFSQKRAPINGKFFDGDAFQFTSDKVIQIPRRSGFS